MRRRLYFVLPNPNPNPNAVSIPNSRLRRFQPAIDRGKILLMVDVPVRRVKEIRDLIISHYPEAQARGQEAQVPAFPCNFCGPEVRKTAATAAVFFYCLNVEATVILDQPLSRALPAAGRRGGQA